ncbi:MAG: hypothetical protein AAFR90_06080 [Pseudomonadota bacterium]
MIGPRLDAAMRFLNRFVRLSFYIPEITGTLLFEGSHHRLPVIGIFVRADIYDLDQKGRDILYDAWPEVTRLMRQKTDSPIKQFVHAMMICDAMAAIEVGVRQAGHQLVTWQDRRQKRPPQPHALAVSFTV